jgi:hypothetical protein
MYYNNNSNTELKIQTSFIDQYCSPPLLQEEQQQFDDQSIDEWMLMNSHYVGSETATSYSEETSSLGIRTPDIGILSDYSYLYQASPILLQQSQYYHHHVVSSKSLLPIYVNADKSVH